MLTAKALSSKKDKKMNVVYLKSYSESQTLLAIHTYKELAVVGGSLHHGFDFVPLSLIIFVMMSYVTK